MPTEERLTAAYVRDVILAGLGGELRVEGPPIQARVSTIFKAATHTAPWPLAVKVYADGIRPEVVAKQGEILARAHQAMSPRPDLTVPAVWAALPEHRTLVMEWIGEPQLSRLFASAGARRGDRARLFGVAGRWLRHFHDRSGVSVAPLDVQTLLNRTDAMLNGEASAGDTEFRRYHELLLRIAPELAGLPVGHVRAHGDFNPNNLLHGPARTVGIDLGITPMLPVTYDIGRFLVQAETAKPFLGSRTRLGPFGAELLDWEAFHAAYGVLSPPLDARQWAFLYLAEIVRRWATFVGLRPSGRFDLGRRVKRHRLKRMASSAAAVLEGQTG